VVSAADCQYMLAVDGEFGDQRVSVNTMLEVSSSQPVAAAGIMPANAATDVSSNQPLYWTPVEDAFRYDLEVATDIGFTNVVVSANGLTTSSYAGGSLPTAETLYWRVTSHNSCGQSISETYSFTTSAPMCDVYTSTNVPINISATDVATVTSVLDVKASGEVVDVNVINLNGTHSYVGDLTFKLQGPQIVSHETNARHAERALVTLIDESCGSADNFSLSLDDWALRFAQRRRLCCWTAMVMVSRMCWIIAHWLLILINAILTVMATVMCAIQI